MIFLLRKSDIETYGFSDIIFAIKTARRAISLGFSRISLRSNITRRKANITEKDDCFRNRLFLGGGWWIRTTEGIASRFTVCPLWPLGKSPIFDDCLIGFNIQLPALIGAGRRTRLINVATSVCTGVSNLPPAACDYIIRVLIQLPALIGAGRRTRTPDLLITNQLLYQLSYTGGSNRTRLL